MMISVPKELSTGLMHRLIVYPKAGSISSQPGRRRVAIF